MEELLFQISFDIIKCIQENRFEELEMQGCLKKISKILLYQVLNNFFNKKGVQNNHKEENMKRNIVILFLIFLAANAFCKAKEEIIQPDELKKIIEQHPLVEKADIYEVYYDSLIKAMYYKSKGEDPKCTYFFDLDLTLTNGHTLFFKEIPNSLSFHSGGGLLCINDNIKDIYFSSIDYKEDSCFGRIKLKDLCKATNTNYYDLYSILDNYNEFCRLLNSIPWRLNKNAEKLCARYSEKNYVYLYRGSGSTSEENKFIEIPEE